MMMFRIALAFGCTIAELNERMSAQEFQEWCAYYNTEPWGCEAADVRHAMASYASIMPHITKRQRITPNDMLPHWAREHKERAKPHDIANALRATMPRKRRIEEDERFKELAEAAGLIDIDDDEG